VDSILYVIGGRVPGIGNIASVESYNPATNEWTSRAPMPTARSGLASASLRGRIFVFGGEIPGVYAQNEMYDPLTDTWETMAPMPVGRHGLGAAAVGDTIFVIGGAPVQGYGLTDVNQGFVPPASIITHTGSAGVPESDVEVDIYPNPASAAITIRVRASESGTVDISLVDVLGRIVRITSADLATGGSTEVSLHATDLPSGIYFVRTGISVNLGAPGDIARETVGSVVLMSSQ
ncbi:MAG TPA: kelch repeat-containing protein, partial [Rhodothermales bacterium]